METGGFMTPDVLIRGGRVIDPAEGVDTTADLLLQDGRVTAIGADLPAVDRIIEASGLVVCPGFIDLHTHLRFPGFAHKETMISGTQAAAAGGFTTVCAMANTEPVVDDVSSLRAVYDEVERVAGVHVRQLAAVSIGLRGRQLTDMRALVEAGAVAFSDDGKPVWDDSIMRAALEASEELGRPVSVHEEDPGIVGRGVANAGPIARRLGLPEWPCSGEARMLRRDLVLLTELGGRLHVAHVSCAETVGLLREARSRGLPVTAEATPHHLRLTDELLEGDVTLGLTPAHPCCKVNPPLRSPADVETLIEAVADGTIDAIATDHAPHAADDKSGAFVDAAFGFSAIETALPLLLDLVRDGRLSLSTLIRRLTVGPARAFGLPGGTLCPGAPADVCIFDPDERWQVTEEALRSLGKNTPLLNARLRGRVRYTMVSGRVVHGP